MGNVSDLSLDFVLDAETSSWAKGRGKLVLLALPRSEQRPMHKKSLHCTVVTSHPRCCHGNVKDGL